MRDMRHPVAVDIDYPPSSPNETWIESEYSNSLIIIAPHAPLVALVLLCA